MQKFKSIPILLATILFVLSSPGFQTVSAQAPVSIKISPLTFKYSLDKGEKKSDLISITNRSKFEVQIQSQVEDFVMGDEEGTPQFLPQGSGTTSLATWVKVSLSKFTLAPLETKAVSFQISVPKDAEPGGHYAAIFFKTLPKKAVKETTLGVAGRVGTLVLVEVTGEVKKTGEIVEFKAPKIVNRGPVNFKVRFKNTGTVHFQPKGAIKISSWFNKNLAEIPLQEHEVLPNSIRLLWGKWDCRYLFGLYKANLEMKDGEGKVLTASVRFFAFPWKIVLIVLAGIFILFVILRLLKKKFKIVRKEKK